MPPRTMAEHTDIAVVGGGMVGLGCALALSQLGLKVLLLEAQAAELYAPKESGFDDRTLVVNPASKTFWQQLGIWQKLESLTIPINQVHVSNQGHFGVVQFDAEKLGVTALGAVVAAKDLVQCLWQAAQADDNIKVLTQAQLQSFDNHESGVRIHYQRDNQDGVVDAALMVAADGARSQIRTSLGLASEVKSYQRMALVCNVQFNQHHRQCAYERLTKTGPLALLPFHQGRCGLVWSVDSTDADDLLALNDDALTAVLQKQLGYRMGAITALGRRSSYPVYQVKVEKQIAQSVVLMGNAAHAVSPVSAQGLNLAVRGIQRLVSVLAGGIASQQPISDHALLVAYEQRSQDDQRATMNYTDDLMTWFAIDAPWVNGLRSLGLLAVETVPMIKRHLFERAGGLKA